MDIKVIALFLIFYFVGFVLGLTFNKSKHKNELLHHDRMWGEVTTYILENNSTFDENGVFECKHSYGNMRIEKEKIENGGGE